MSHLKVEELTPEQSKMRKKRTRVAQELLETEVTYIQNLDILKSCFYDPFMENAKSSTKVISVDDVRAIFGSLNIILPVNKLLLSELEKRLQVSDTEYLLIGEAFETYVRKKKTQHLFSTERVFLSTIE